MDLNSVATKCLHSQGCTALLAPSTRGKMTLANPAQTRRQRRRGTHLAVTRAQVAQEFVNIPRD